MPAVRAYVESSVPAVARGPDRGSSDALCDRASKTAPRPGDEKKGADNAFFGWWCRLSMLTCIVFVVASQWLRSVVTVQSEMEAIRSQQQPRHQDQQTVAARAPKHDASQGQQSQLSTGLLHQHAWLSAEHTRLVDTESDAPLANVYLQAVSLSSDTPPPKGVAPIRRSDSAPDHRVHKDHQASSRYAPSKSAAPAPLRRSQTSASVRQTATASGSNVENYSANEMKRGLANKAPAAAATASAGSGRGAAPRVIELKLPVSSPSTARSAHARTMSTATTASGSSRYTTGSRAGSSQAVAAVRTGDPSVMSGVCTSAGGALTSARGGLTARPAASTAGLVGSNRDRERAACTRLALLKDLEEALSTERERMKVGCMLL